MSFTGDTCNTNTSLAFIMLQSGLVISRKVLYGYETWHFMTTERSTKLALS